MNNSIDDVHLHERDAESPASGLLCALIVLIAAVAPMIRLLHAEFTNWDDAHTITENRWLAPPTLRSLAKIWTQPKADLYVPVTYSFWWCLAKFSHTKLADGTVAQSAAVFHAANIAVHALTALALFALLRKLFKTDWLALAGAALFSVHPVQVESVAWISGGKDLLCGLFSVIAIWQYIAYAQLAQREKTSASAQRYVLALIAFALAILAKPSAVAVPLMLLPIEWLILRRPFAPIVRGIVPMFALALAGAVEARHFQTATGLTTLVTVWQRFPVALDAIGFYLHKLVVSVDLAFDYGRNPRAVVTSGVLRTSWILPTIGCIWIALARRKFPRILAGALVFLCALLPMLGFTPFDFQEYSTVADHYMYLPMIGVAIAFAAALAHVRYRIIVAIVVPAITIPLAIISFRQTPFWMNSIALMNHAIDVNPQSWAAYTNLGNALEEESRFDEALDAEEHALALRWENSDANIVIGAIELQTGQIAAATQALERAVRQRPSSEAHTNLADAYGQAGRFDDSIVQYEKALTLDPENAVARRMLERTRAFLLHEKSRAK